MSTPEHAAGACLTAYQEIIEAWPDDDPCPDPSDIDLRVAFTLAIAPFYEEWVGHSIPNRAAEDPVWKAAQRMQERCGDAASAWEHLPHDQQLWWRDRAEDVISTWMRSESDAGRATPNSAATVPGSYVLHLHSDGTYSLEKAT